MKIVFYSAILALIAISCDPKSSDDTSNQKPTPVVSINPEKAKKEISTLLDDLWTSGYAKKDTSIVSALYHPGFTLVDDEGSIFSKEAEMNYVVNYGQQYENFSYSIDNIHVFDNGNAIVFAKCKFTGTDASGQVFITEYFQSVTFSVFNAEWKIIHSQVSGVKESSIANAPGE